MVSVEEISIFKEALSQGCCLRCSVRFVGLKKIQDVIFDDIEEGLLTTGLAEVSELLFEPPTKKHKSLACVVCLGTLEDNFLDHALHHKELEKIVDYKSETFGLLLEAPSCQLIREHSMKLHLCTKFPDTFNFNAVTSLNKAWRAFLGRKLGEKLGKKHDQKSKLFLRFILDYNLNWEESRVAQDFCHLKPNSNLSKRHIGRRLMRANEKSFRKHVLVPPRKTLDQVRLAGVECVISPCFVYGTFCKYDRALFTTHVEGQETVETIVCRAVTEVLSLPACVPCQFHSKPMEGAYTRVVGQGKPFYIEISHFTSGPISEEDLRKIEAKVRESKVVSVSNLMEWKEGKATLCQFIMEVHQKPRNYKALCIVEDCDDLRGCVRKVNDLKTITVHQRTPVRVLNQRENAVRPRTVHSIRATAVEGTDCWMEIDLCSDAGLLILEFFNGDFGRTKPSLRSVLGKDIEVLALDFMGFEMSDSQSDNIMATSGQHREREDDVEMSDDEEMSEHEKTSIDET